MASCLREARLKPEYARLYPFLEPGVWHLASSVSFKVTAWLLRQPGCNLDGKQRVLSDDHFDFRGGGPAPRGAQARRGEA